MRPISIISLCFLAVLPSVFNGCTKESEPTAPPTNGGGTTGSPVSPAQRKGAFDAVTRIDSTIDWTNPTSAKQQLVQFLQSRREFEASGANADASVWARFTDGRTLVIAHNRAPDDTSAAASLNAWPPIIPGIAGGELPTSRTAAVMFALGNAFTNTATLIGQMFKAKGYTLSPSNGSIANLRAVSGVGAFYIAAHGGCSTLRDGSTIYSIWTSDLFDTTSDASLKPLWDNGELGYFTAYQDKQSFFLPGRYTLETHFGITPKFVTNEMSFGKNSLLYFNSCGSAGPNSGPFMAACLAKTSGSTGAYAGWTNTTDDDAATVTAYFIIDRLLGTNMDPNYKENPPQRPFTYPQIMSELIAKHLGTSVTSDGLALLTITPASASFGFFAPSIEKLSINDERHELNVYGLFGSDLGDAKVTLNDQALNIQSGSPGQLVCTLDPNTQNTGGDVKVIVHGDTSNVVQLTEWKGKVQITASFPGAIGYTVTFSFHLRADLHSFRTAPGGNAQPQVLEGISGMPDCRADCNGAGIITDAFPLAGGGCTEKITEVWPTTNDSATINGPPGRRLAMAADVRPQDKTLSLYFGVSINNFVTDSVQDSLFCPGSPPGGGHYTAPWSLGTSDTLEFPMDNGFNLVDPGVYQHPIFDLVAYSLDQNLPHGTLTVKFLGAETKYPPDPKAGQGPAHRKTARMIQ